MNFQELGLTLKHERERKGLSIEVVMEATKISRTNIVAMENGDRNTLPHPVYTKGFVKSYARYLGLDDSEFSMVVDREYQDEMDGPEEHVYEVSAAAEKAFQDTEYPERKGKSKWPLLLVAVVLIILAALLFLNLRGGDKVVSVEEVSPSSEVVESASEVEQPAAEEVVEEAQRSNEDEAVKADPDERGDAVKAEESVAEPEEEQTPAAQVEEASSAAVEPITTPEAEDIESASTTEEAISKPSNQKYDHVIIIRATTDKGCWIGLWKGDETKMYRDYVLKKGEPLRLMFNTLRRIRIGNAAGVTVTYNGQPYSLDDAKGNIQTLRFGE